MKRTLSFGWVMLLLGLVAVGCGDSSGHGDDDAGIHGDGTVGDDAGFTSPVLDPDFGDNGVLRVPSTWSLDCVYAAERNADGDLLVGGTTVELGHRTQPLLARFNGAGELDTTFGGNGFVLVPFHDYSEVTDLAALPDGGVVAVGTSWFEDNFAFAVRLDGQGALDPSFGDGGILLWDNYSDYIAVAVDSTGAVLVLQVLQEGTSDSELMRLTPAGVVDASFGSGGSESVPGEDPRDLILLADERILTLTHENGTSWVHRYTADGYLDTTFFGGGGASFELEAFDLAVSQTTGGLLIAGNGDNNIGQVVQLDADGAPVTTFGTDGIADVTSQGSLARVGWLPNGEALVLDAEILTFPEASYRDLIRIGADGTPLAFDTTTADQLYGAYVSALLMDPDGGTYLVGTQRLAVDTPGGADIRISALGMTHDGTPLAGFGESGLAQAGSQAPSEVVWDMAVLSDGDHLVVGSAGLDPILMRIVDGALDPAYGTDGIAFGYPSQLLRIAIDDADRVVAVNGSASVTRFLADGTFDDSFGTNGYLQNLPGQVRNLTIDAQQRIVVCGWETNQQVPMLARFGSDGTPDTSFGDAGAVLGYDGTEGVANTIRVDADGKIVVCGELWSSMAYPELYMARLNEDGTMDTSFGDSGVSVLGGSAGANRILSRSGGGYLLVNQSAFDEALQVYATLSTGQLDPSFGDGGVVTIEAKEWPVLGFLELDAGRILVAGGVINGHNDQLAVWCLQPDGRPDTDFADNGVFLLPGIGRATALAPDGDGVLVAGFVFNRNTGTDVALLRLLP